MFDPELFLIGLIFFLLALGYTAIHAVLFAIRWAFYEIKARISRCSNHRL